MKTYHIVVLEDNEFYNSMLTKQLDFCAKQLEGTNDFNYDITSYTSVKDCLRNLKEDTNIAFLDYYLGEGITAMDVLKEMKKKNPDCKVIVISRIDNEQITKDIITNGALEFLVKNKNAFLLSGRILEDIITGQC
jgi:DNA-binding NtrC family response regulator